MHNPTGHTPGPWTAVKLDDDGHYDITANNGAAVIAGTAGWYGEHNPGEANARLIAAAPEMLEACRLYRSWRERAEPCRAAFGWRLDAALAAIAKAEGRVASDRWASPSITSIQTVEIA